MKQVTINKNVLKFDHNGNVIIELPKGYSETNIVKAILYKEETMGTGAPEWFKAFEKKNDARWDKQEKFNENIVDFIGEQREFNKDVINRLDGIVKANNLKDPSKK